MVINAIARYDKDVNEVTVLGDDEFFVKMSGGDVDVEPYLCSRNTIGHGNHNSNSQRPKATMVEAESGGGRGMSIASQRAKERENRTPDVEVTLKMVKLRMLKLAWAVVPLGRAVVPLEVLSGGTARRGGCTARLGFDTEPNGARFWGGIG